MDADWSVEIGGDAPALEFPWRAPDASGPRYRDLKHHPELIDDIPEAAHYPELRDFLLALNAPSSPLETAKCDVWTTTDLNEEEEIYGACKCACYVDLVFSREYIVTRYSFEAHECLARSLAHTVRGDELPATAEFVVRRCYYEGSDAPDTATRSGFYVTLYISGYGNDETEARRHWAQALRILATSLHAAVANPKS